MAKWRAKSQLYVGNRLVARGEEFDTDHKPGAQWEPRDDDAAIAFDEYVSGRAAQGSKVEPAKPLISVAADPTTVPIPDDWRDLMAHKRINLARRLGAPVKGTGTAEADATIEAELAKRAAAPVAEGSEQ